MKIKALFETPISYIHAYKLPKLGEKKQIPIISDTMFDTMFNNESRIKYVSYFLSLILDMPYDKIINKIHLIKNKVSNQININNFTFEGNKAIIEKFRFTNEEGKILTNKLTLYYIYLPNIRKKYYNEGEKKLSELEKMFLILNAENDNLKELLGGNKIMKDYVKDAIDASSDNEVPTLVNSLPNLYK